LADAETADAVWARDAALLTDTVRQAGALALSLFRTSKRKRLSPIIARTMPLMSAADAHRFVERRSSVGRVVLTHD